MTFARRQFLAGAAMLIATCTGGALSGFGRRSAHAAPAEFDLRYFGETTPFSRDRLYAAAEALSKQPFKDRSSEIPEPLRGMNYSAYRDMQPGKAWPHPLADDGVFGFDALLSGFVFNQPVDVWVVAGDIAKRVVFEWSAYWFGPRSKPHLPDGPIPFSGFRLHADTARTGTVAEFCVFQGASYFRAVGGGETYGLSARGLAIDTGSVHGEEFPVFRAFWIEETANDDVSVTVYALLDSPSTTGLYTFRITPGDATRTDIDVTLFPRRAIETIGFAPFSSMFLFNEINRARFTDYRDAVHDSNGLSILTGTGEWLWRPITNPVRLQVSAFVDENPRGFGLIQRKRRFDDYDDAEARYELRTSAWVEPRGDWGEGSVVLFEIPTAKEWNDNIVAYWQPKRPIEAGTPFSYAYSIYWDALAPMSADGPSIASTRVGRNFSDTRWLFVVDYRMNGASSANARAEVASSAGQTVNLVMYTTPEDGILRLSFELDPKAENLIELRLDLHTADGPPAERWLYRWTA